MGRVSRPVSLVAYSLATVIVRISGGLRDFAISIAFDAAAQEGRLNHRGKNQSDCLHE